MTYKSFNFCVFFIILSLKQHQTRNVSWACIFTSWPGFVCMCVCVCLCLTETDPLTGRAGWVWGLEPPSTQSLWRHTDSLTPMWTFGGVAEATAEARGQHSCSWQTIHSFAQSTERRQSPQGAHMSQHALHKPSCYSLSFSVFYPHKWTHVPLI